MKNPRFADCFTSGGDRLYNQDETALISSTSKQKVLTPKGWKDVIYNMQSSTRIHVTCSLTVSASGKFAGVRCVYSGVKNVAQGHLKDLPKTGLCGEVQFSVTDTGFMTRLTFLDVLMDLDNYLVRNSVQRPVVLVLDGFSGHTGLGKYLNI